MLLALLAIGGLASLSGCVVYEPRPAYAVYDGPAVVVYHPYYGYYYHRGWR